jgi:hypothetical protein
MKFHKGVEGKSYFCVYCDKSFFKKSGLKQHLLDFHLDQEADEIENFVQGDFQSLVHLMEVKVRKRTKIGSRFKNKNDESKIERNIFETDSKRKFSDTALFEFCCGAVGPMGPCTHVCTGTSGCHYIKKHILKKHSGYVYRFVAEDEDCLDLVISENTKLRNDDVNVGKKNDVLLNCNAPITQGPVTNMKAQNEIISKTLEYIPPIYDKHKAKLSYDTAIDTVLDKFKRENYTKENLPQISPNLKELADLANLSDTEES